MEHMRYTSRLLVLAIGITCTTPPHLLCGRIEEEEQETSVKLEKEKSPTKTEPLYTAADLAKTPFFSIPTLSPQVVSTALAYGRVGFVKAEETKAAVTRFDTLRGIVDVTRYTKAGTKLSVCKHETRNYADGIKIPLQFNHSGRANSDADKQISRILGANSDDHEYGGPTLTTLYLEKTPLWIDAKTAADINDFLQYLAEELVNLGFDATSVPATYRPIVVITISNDPFLQTISADSWNTMNSYFNIASFLDEPVRNLFLDARRTLINISSNSLFEVGVPLWQGIYNDYSSMAENFEWRRMIRKGLKGLGEDIFSKGIPVFVALVAYEWLKGYWDNDADLRKMAINFIANRKMAAAFKENGKNITVDALVAAAKN